ncbi:hypothetical protein LAZ67_2005525 [Cordylochernes scorpioides]|uniref:RNA-directed DNA polymerase n=1 Tax=Cordylochernes scorpioides TaxID=51811 RepID=A0ABY6K610_9ARAC|nr:hypothetical protein LAZ67_2005525 [Cordylochernes scorpioides]
MEDASMGEQEKLLRLPNYLVRQPLELFRKLRLADRSYFQVRQILLDLYPESNEASFAKYFAMKLTGQANLETYYREKTAMGLQLGLPQEVILETLTEGLPFNDQRLVRVVPPENLGEWFRLVQRIHGPSVPATRSREDQPPTMSAFATFEGLYQPTRLPFGLKTSPQIYERAISQVLQRHGLDCVAHYFDDFIIYSNTLEEHQNHLRQFFAFCEAEKLQLNFAKCEFFKTSINFLGYTITAGTITPLTRNTDIIHAIKQPHNRKTLQSFLGAVNVYNKFIPEYARLRAPLNNLLKKDVVWNWNEACQEAFIDLKGNLTQHPILHLYKEGLPCQVYCDASTLGIAGILKQVHPDGNVYPVQYFSRTLRPHEKNYSISELECLAIVESVEKFRIYLMGRKFTIFSDHHALQWLKTIKNPSGRLFRWSLRLSSYEYEVRYIKGKLQYEADLLSRNPFCGFLDATLIKTHQSPPSKESSLTIDHNGLHTVSRKGVTKIILPKPLIQQLLQTVHTQYNHPGISQMSRIISTQYYWQGMSKDIKQKVKTCPTCQLTKRPVGPTYGELSQPPESKEPFDLLSLDTIAGFAKYGNTKIYLHVVVDHFSRYAWAFPSKSTSTITYQQVLKRVFQDGSPKRLLTDRAPAFTSPKFRSFLLNRNIHPLITTSNNPQANGLCERLNATLTGKLRLLHLENPKVAWTKLVKKRMPGHRKRRQFKQTDAFTRGMVIGLKRAGWSIRQIAADTHLGASTVHRLWRRWLEQGNVAIYRNVGATRVMSARVDRRILRQAVAAPQATCTAILQHVQDTLDHSISTRTISRRLVANGLHSCRPLRRLPLTPLNRRQRLEWCRARSTWLTEWHRVVFSDESRFCLSSDSRRVRVWRRRGERSNPAAIVERPTVRQRGIMVWGATAYDSRSPLLRIQGTMTANDTLMMCCDR